MTNTPFLYAGVFSLLVLTTHAYFRHAMPRRVHNDNRDYTDQNKYSGRVRPFFGHRKTDKSLMPGMFMASVTRSLKLNPTLVIFVDCDQTPNFLLFRLGEILKNKGVFAVLCGNSERRYDSVAMECVKIHHNHCFLKSLRSKDAADAILIMCMMSIAETWKVSGYEDNGDLEFLIISNDSIFEQAAITLSFYGINVYIDSNMRMV